MNELERIAKEQKAWFEEIEMQAYEAGLADL